jgi:hypothetical protein
MSTGRPWQPRIDEDRILNPFAPATEASQPVEDIEVQESEEQGGEGEEASDATTEPSTTDVKVGKTPPATD